ncbi:E3 ubiquitin-protein ligase BRE1-like 1 isoform X3 [Magnolia sinica]|uniref:E3 ubiquitin-protein ligase BRE1-like 1 isoform X3 n=1 Tax=Magnolia sinica TaxID=86752 RepID=UPI0026582012|nr:E3 ubiquitin-protein ligase BRE1-like 1 isoform X3 [Magnolia sinica]
MGSIGESDRKRRHLNSISPMSTATTKKHPHCPSSEDNLRDSAVLQYQNEKLFQQLEAQKSEFLVLENKLHQLKEKQQTYDAKLKLVNRSWEQVAGDLESLSIRTRGSANGGDDVKHSRIVEDGASCPPKDAFLSRLLETGAIDSCSTKGSPHQMNDDIKTSCSTTNNIISNIIAAINDWWHVIEVLSAALLETLPEDDLSKQMQKTTNGLEMDVKSLQVALSDLHLKHRLLMNEVQIHRDTNAKNKAKLKHLAGELENTTAELEESNCKLTNLKAQKDASQGAFFPVLNLGNKYAEGDKVRDKRKELQDMESALKQSLDLASNRLVELGSVHEERIGILKQLAKLENTMKGVKHISSSKTYLLLSNQIEKSKAEVDQCHALLEKLQVEREDFVWWEKEMNMKVDLADISQRTAAIVGSRVIELEMELKRQISEKNLLKSRLEKASREPGRKEIIAEFKGLLSSLPKDMDVMQSRLSEYKEAALEVHSLRAEVQSLSNIIDRKSIQVTALGVLSSRSAEQVAEIQKMQAVVWDLKESEKELNLILEMYGRESTDSRDLIESRDLEYKAWACVQSLKSSLDEHNLELRVKAANESEAMSQQRLANAEAEIADLRRKLETSGRDIGMLSDVLKSKHEEGEAYLSEIESIGQAYGDMQTQNQQLLQQITERDDYNIKLVLECTKARQVQDALRMEKQVVEKKMQQANASLELYDIKTARIEEQLKICSEQVGKLAEGGWQCSVALESAKKRLLDVKRESQQLKQSLDESESMVARSRLDVVGLQIELEHERSKKKRLEEELEVVARKAASLSALTEDSSVLEKLQEEVREYKEILKCGICHDRQKEVVIAKCYHLLCAACVQRTLDSRRKCPICSTSFGPNDVKNVYI